EAIVRALPVSRRPRVTKGHDSTARSAPAADAAAARARDDGQRSAGLRVRSISGRPGPCTSRVETHRRDASPGRAARSGYACARSPPSVAGVGTCGTLAGQEEHMLRRALVPYVSLAVTAACLVAAPAFVAADNVEGVITGVDGGYITVRPDHGAEQRFHIS